MSVARLPLGVETQMKNLPISNAFTSAPIIPVNDQPTAHSSKRQKTLEASAESLEISAADANYLETPASQALLEALKNKIVTYKEKSPFVDPAGYQRAFREARQIKDEYLKLHHSHLNEKELLELPEPPAFKKMFDMASKLVQQNLYNKKLDAIIRNRPSLKKEEISVRTPEAIDALYAEGAKEEKTQKSVTTNFAELIKFAKLDGKAEYRIDIDRINEHTFSVDVGGDEALGYAVHHILQSAAVEERVTALIEKQKLAGKTIDKEKIRDQAIEEHESIPYDSETHFTITVARLNALEKKLDQMVRLSQDTPLIFTELLATKKGLVINEHLQLAQKSVFEMLKYEEGTTPAAKLRFQKMHQEKPVLLFDSLSLDLTTHPDRDGIKTEMERMYVSAKLKDANKNQKEFIHTDLFRTNLQVGQLAKIAPGINELLSARREIDEKYGMSIFWDDARLKIQNTTRLNLTIQARKEKLIARALAIDPNAEKNSNLIHPERDKDGNIAYPGRVPLLDKSKSFLEASQWNSIVEKEIIDFFAIGKISEDKKSVNTNELTNEHKTSLYPKDMRLPIFLQNNKVPLAIKNDHTTDVSVLKRQVAQLFTALRNTEMYGETKKIWPDIEIAIGNLEKEFKQRFEGNGPGGTVKPYNALPEAGYYGKKMVRTAVESLETYVGKIKYQDQLNISKEAIQYSFSIISGHVGEEMSAGCAAGFGGRMNDPLTALMSTTGDKLDDRLNTVKHECVENAFRKVFGYSAESSMALPEKDKLLKALGVISVDEGSEKYTLDSIKRNHSRGREFVAAFVDEYTAAKVFDVAYDIVTNEFWENAKTGNNDEVRKLLVELGFDPGRSINGEPLPPEQQFAKYHVNREADQPWQFAYFKHELSEKLFAYLQENDYVEMRDPKLRREVDATKEKQKVSESFKAPKTGAEASTSKYVKKSRPAVDTTKQKQTAPTPMPQVEVEQAVGVVTESSNLGPVKEKNE